MAQSNDESRLEDRAPLGAPKARLGPSEDRPTAKDLGVPAGLDGVGPISPDNPSPKAVYHQTKSPYEADPNAARAMRLDLPEIVQNQPPPALHNEVQAAEEAKTPVENAAEATETRTEQDDEDVSTQNAPLPGAEGEKSPEGMNSEDLRAALSARNLQTTGNVHTLRKRLKDSKWQRQTA